MADRYQNDPSGSWRSGERGFRDYDGDDLNRNYDRDYGQYGQDRETRGHPGSYDAGRVQFRREDERADREDPRGRHERFEGHGYGYGQSDPERTDYSRDAGQSRYGQSGYGRGGYGQGRGGEPNYRYSRPSYGEEGGSSGTSQYGRSQFSTGTGGGYDSANYGNYGSGASSGSERGGRQAFENWREPQPNYRSGPHRGKGPKGYQRTDERTRELICERLRDDPEIDASEITVNVQGGKVILDGTVDSRWTKNAAEDVAEQFGSEVQNNLRVQRTTEGAQSTWGQSAATGGAEPARGTQASADSSKTKQH